jgi:RHS repeat-associated protein
LFDAWGNVLVQDGAGNTLSGLTVLDRGYTGHEHLQSVGLIHMNGRLYDAKLHRFLQPDNYVQDPSNTQNYNRYGYVLNNPLKYIDPSGEQTSPNCDICGGNNNYPDYNPDNMKDQKDLADAIKHWVGGFASARNFDEAGTAVGKAARDATNFVVGNVRSFFKGLFDGGDRSSGPLPNMGTNVNMNPYTPSGSNSFGQINSSNANWVGVVGNSSNQIVLLPKPQMTELGMGAFEWVEGGGLIKGGEKLYEVYQLVNKETKVVEYVGKTSQGMMKRFNQHLLDPAKQAWIHNVEPVLFEGNLTRFEAKYYEQTQIMSKGLGNLYNRINAVAEKYWIKYGIK